MASLAPSQLSHQRYAKDASIVLLGMRGGKTIVGSMASKALGWELIDTDFVFCSLFKQDLSSYITAHGWDDFRTKESQILAALLSRYPTNRIIACASGIIDRAENRNLLKRFAHSTGPVIHILREKDVVLKFLQENSSFSPEPPESFAEAWDRREMYHRECASYELPCLSIPDIDIDAEAGSDSLLLKPIESSFFRLLRFIHSIDTNHAAISPGAPRTYLLSLTFEDVASVIPIIEEVSVGIDAWEIRVDHLRSRNLNFLAFQVATLRRHSELPILFTVRSQSQGGHFPNLFPQADNFKKNCAQYYSLIQHAFKLGCEYVDVELELPESMFASLIQQKGNSKVLGSWHDTHGSISWTGPETLAIYEKAVRLQVDIVEIINTARRFEDNLGLRSFADLVAPRGVPLLALNMGAEGKMSRVLNPILAPLSHPLMPTIAAPGQISFAEYQQILYLTGLLHPRQFYLFGSPIEHSLSPILHRTAIAGLSLPHTFTPVTSSTIDHPSLRNALSSPNFGGAAMTIPLKIPAISLCTRISNDARLIGAVNTLISIPGPDGRSGIYGENTDWRAIKTSIVRHLSVVNAVTARTTAIVIGAGGTARAAIYALYMLGVANVWLWNRTRSRAEALIAEMCDGRFQHGGGIRIRILEALDGESVRKAVLGSALGQRGALDMPTIVISTIPAVEGFKDEGHAVVGQQKSTMVRMPDVGLEVDLFKLSPTGGVAVELAYRPRVTPLLRVVASLTPASTPSSSHTATPRTHGSPDPASKSKETSGKSGSDTSSDLIPSKWIAVEGVEILLEQGYEQVRLWTDRRAPKSLVRRTVLEEFEQAVKMGFA